jgi:hypothetical protein
VVHMSATLQLATLQFGAGWAQAVGGRAGPGSGRWRQGPAGCEQGRPSQAWRRRRGGGHGDGVVSYWASRARAAVPVCGSWRWKVAARGSSVWPRLGRDLRRDWSGTCEWAGRRNIKNLDISDAQVVWTAQWLKTTESKFFGGPTKK